MACPIGHHSPGLQKLLRRLRSEPVPGKHALLGPVEGKWLLVTCTGRRDRPLEWIDRLSFHGVLEAERYVFRLRWRATFAEELPANVT